MFIPFQDLSAEALNAIIEDWLSRQSQESVYDISEKDHYVEQVRQQLRTQKLLITWDDELNTINIISADAIAR